MPAVEGELYLGGFASAPTLDNEGNPLQLGNLYWNTASNNLWAYDGATWVRTNFNETTPFFTQFTTSGTARSLEVRMRQDISSVRDWGATGSGTTDDTLAIQNAIAFSFNDYVYFPPGTYRVTAPIVIEKPIRIIGAGSQKSFISIDHSGNGIVFQPVGAGTSNVFLNFAEIENIAVQRSTAITTPGTNIWIRQCNGFKAKGVTSFDGSVGFRFSGGQLNSLLQCRAYVSNASMTPQPENACVIFEEAPLSGGGFQYCYTTNIEDFQGLGTNIINYGILVKSMDGLNISNAFFSFFNVSQIEFNRQSLNTQITGVNISNVYFDCTGFFGGPGTPHAITCTNARPAGTSGLGTLNVTNCILANNANEGTFNALIDFSKYGSHIKFANCYIANSGPEWGVELYDSTVGGPSGTYIFTGNTFSNLSNAAGGGALYAKDVDLLVVDGNTFKDTATAAYQVLVDGDNGSVSAVGNITDGSSTQMVTIPGAATFTGNVVLLNAGQTTTNIVRLALPTAITGLPSGAMWNNAGVVNIVP
jgi:hypothetical protein